MSILARLRQSKPETAADIDLARKEIQAALKAEQASIDALEKRRDDMVLDGTEAEIIAADAEIAAAERRLRDLDIARVRLAQRHEEAVKTEHRAVVEAAGKALAQRIARRAQLMAAAAKAVQQLDEAAVEYGAIEAERAAHNKRCADLQLGDLALDSGWDAMLAKLGGRSPEHTREAISQVLGIAARARPLVVYADMIAGPTAKAK